MKYKYIEIRRRDGTLVKRFDVTGSSERTIDRTEDGMNINLNHDEFLTIVEEYDEPQPLNP